MIAPLRLLQRLSLSVKFVGTIVIVASCVVAVVGHYSIQHMLSSLEQAYIEKAEATARLLDAGIRNTTELGDTGTLFEYLQRHRWLEPDILNIDLNLVGPKGLYVAVSTDNNRTGMAASNNNLLAYQQDKLNLEFHTANGPRFLRLITPVHIARRQVGTFQMDLSMDYLDHRIWTAIAGQIAGYVAIVAAVIVLGIFVLRRNVLIPLKALERGIQSVSSGQFHHQLKIKSNDELGRLARSFNRMNCELRRSTEKINYLALHDALTGLPNRRVLQDRLEQELARCMRDHRKGVLVYLGIDHFKDINDTLGHSVGDRLLQEISVRLRENLRATDTTARTGGDEFAILLGEYTGDVVIESVAVTEKLLAQLAQEFNLGDQRVHITVSIGICAFPEYGEDAETVISNADTALYNAKDRGRNRVSVFNARMEQSLQNPAVLRRELKKGIADQQFFLAYQPQLDNHGRLVGVEALIRWQHPQQGLLMPSQFISIAEESDIICELGEWVLHQACVEFTRWIREENLDDAVMLSVNVSPRQFHSPEFVNLVKQIPDTTGIDLRRLTLEVTEGTLLVDSEDVIRKMHELSRLGVGFSLDDFGTGYSSLSYLKHLPVSCLKIDRVFVEDVCHSDDDAAIAEIILNVARQYGLKVVAEGVETEEQLQFFNVKGCQYYQGYFFDRPMTADRFVQQRLKMAAKADFNSPVTNHPGH